MDNLKPLLLKLATGSPLLEKEAQLAFDIVMSGGATPSQIGALCMGMRVRGETVDEIAGAAKSMREKALKMEAPEGSVDTAGTGGDGMGTYNVSTAAAIVAAACGVPVAKHGNKAISLGCRILRVMDVLLDRFCKKLRRPGALRNSMEIKLNR